MEKQKPSDSTDDNTTKEQVSPGDPRTESKPAHAVEEGCEDCANCDFASHCYPEYKND